MIDQIDRPFYPLFFYYWDWEGTRVPAGPCRTWAEVWEADLDDRLEKRIVAVRDD